MSLLEDIGKLIRSEVQGEEAAAVLSAAAAAFDQVLAERPGAAEVVDRIMERHLGDPLGVETMTAVRDSLKAYLGDELSLFIAWAMLQPDGSELLAGFEGVAAARVGELVRRLRGVHGVDFRQANILWNERPQDWSTVNARTLFDEGAQRHYFRVRLEKYGGEVLGLEGDCNSILRLVTFLTGVLSRVGLPEQFDANAFNEFLQNVQALHRSLVGEQEGDEAEQEPEVGPAN